MKNRDKKFLYLFLALFLLVNMSLAAYQLSPLNVTYDASGTGSAKVYTIVNDSDSPIAIEVKAVKRSIDIDGEEYNEDASAYFLIQPNKMIIKPQSTQLVRVQYRGPRIVTKETAYRIVSEQIPYSQGAQAQSEGQTISFLFVYSTSAYVRPTKVIERVSASASINSDGKLEIVLENTGSVHQLLNNLTLTITGSSGAVYKLSDEEVAPLNGENLLVDSRRRLVIDIPSVLAADSTFKVAETHTFSY